MLEFRQARLDAGDGARLVAGMRDEIAALYEGLALDGASMPKAGPAELAAPHGAFLVGYLDGAPACCGGVKRLDERACEIKRMFVAPAFRRRGVARALLHRLEQEARSLGYALARLDTGPRQPGARALYEAEGYRPIGNFNANPVADFFGEKPLG
jgi:GNAT superfamily N-acetyltransferase